MSQFVMSFCCRSCKAPFGGTLRNSNSSRPLFASIRVYSRLKIMNGTEKGTRTREPRMNANEREFRI
jgi:hypothetical protein